VLENAARLGMTKRLYEGRLGRARLLLRKRFQEGTGA
jgi:hypothetical protein